MTAEKKRNSERLYMYGNIIFFYNNTTKIMQDVTHDLIGLFVCYHI